VYQKRSDYIMKGKQRSQISSQPESSAPGVGLEPTSPEGHQLARLYAMISRLTPFRAHRLT